MMKGKSMAEEILDKNVNTVEVDEPEIDGEIKDIEDNTQVEHAYGADDIQILEGLEAVRKDRVCISALQVKAVYITLYTR